MHLHIDAQSLRSIGTRRPFLKASAGDRSDDSSLGIKNEKCMPTISFVICQYR
jgi:hypothetical protein